MKSETGFYQSVLRALDIRVHFSLPRHPQSNGLCENANKQFLQNMRCLMQTCKTTNWVMLTSYCTWLMNAQVSPSTQLTPSEMFLGKAAWRMELVPEPCTSPSIDEWLKKHLTIQQKAAERLKKVRNSTRQRINQGRSPATYQVGEWTLVHNRRWPQRKFPKVMSQWQGPFKVLKFAFNSLEVMASPSLGGPIKVSICDCKK